MARNAQTLSVNTLVIVALAILVLITSVVLYNKYVDRSQQTLESCQNMGGTCKAECDTGQLANRLASCPEGQVCCTGGDDNT